MNYLMAENFIHFIPGGYSNNSGSNTNKMLGADDPSCLRTLSFRPLLKVPFENRNLFISLFIDPGLF